MLRCFGASTIGASTIRPNIAKESDARRLALRRQNKPSITATFFSASRDAQIALAFGTIGQAEPKKAHERQPAPDQILGALAGERAHRPQDQNLEHQHVTEWRAIAFRATGTRHCCFQVRVKHLKVDRAWLHSRSSPFLERSLNRLPSSRTRASHTPQPPLRFTPVESHQTLAGTEIALLYV